MTAIAEHRVRIGRVTEKRPANVVNLRAVTRLDVPASRILAEAMESNLEAVIVIGWDRDGDHYYGSSVADGGDALWLVEKFKTALMAV